MTRKFGGVKITIQRVNAPQPREKFNLRAKGECPCGKSRAECDDDWDVKLGVTSRTTDDYHDNLEKFRRADLEGLDPYHYRARRKADGYADSWGWTPHMPPGSFRVPTTMEVRHGKRTQKPRGKR